VEAQLADKDLDRVDVALETVDEGRRATLRKIVRSAAFTAPAVASFAVGSMMISPAAAQYYSNSTY